MHLTHYRRPAFLASDLQKSDNIMTTKSRKRFSLYVYAPFGIVNEMDGWKDIKSMVVWQELCGFNMQSHFRFSK